MFQAISSNIANQSIDSVWKNMTHCEEVKNDARDQHLFQSMSTALMKHRYEIFRSMEKVPKTPSQILENVAGRLLTQT